MGNGRKRKRREKRKEKGKRITAVHILDLKPHTSDTSQCCVTIENIIVRERSSMKKFSMRNATTS
jgi:hypothetical protein